jgi:hypothetical protein
MDKYKKIEYLKENYNSEWTNTWDRERDKLSNLQPLFCICGRLATGLHELNCKKFKNKVDNNTAISLKHLIKK